MGEEKGGGREGEGKEVRPRTLSVEWRAVRGCVDRAYRAYLLSTYPCVSRDLEGFTGATLRNAQHSPSH